MEEFNPENQNSESEIEEETEVEILEFSLDNLEIEELITKLQLLKESKETVHFEVDDENELLIHYDDEVEGEL